MNVINAYLETMFSKYPQSPRLLEAKAELQAMMEDAYTGFISAGVSENEAVGRVITDFGNLDEVAPVLGITSEIAPVSQAGPPHAATSSGQAAPAPPPAPVHPPVTLEEARGYAKVQESTRFRLSTAVALFVLSPIFIITFPTLAESGLLPASVNVATAFGLLLLFLFVGAGVTLSVGISRDFAPFASVREGRFTRNPVVTNWADALALEHDRKRINALQVAVLLWIFSPVPLIIIALIARGTTYEDVWSVLGVAAILIIVATGLVILLPATWAKTVSGVLGQTGSSASASETDEDRSIVGVIASFYWPLMVVFYLAWSFIGDAWETSWIVWPIAGVLFGAIAAGSGAIEAYRKQR